MSDKVLFPFLIATTIFLALLVICLKWLRYSIIYNFILIITASAPILLLIIDSWFRQERFDKRFLMTLTLFISLFIPTLLVLSMFNLIKKTNIHWFISTIGIILSFIFLMVAGMVANITRAGMIG